MIWARNKTKKPVYPYNVNLTLMNNCEILIKEVLMKEVIKNIERHAWVACHFCVFGEHY